MSKEKLAANEKYIPIMLCPDCVREGLQVDPREKTPDYPVIESTCSTHQIIRGEIHPLLTQTRKTA